MAEWCRCCGVEICAYCLTPNHVHLTAVPRPEEALRRGIGEARHQYTRLISFRKHWRGHLRQGRFASFVLDGDYLLAAARYVEMNPVRAGMVASPQTYLWSSASAHLKGRDDVLAKTAPFLTMVGNWRTFLPEPTAEETRSQLDRHERTGRPLGGERFLTKRERRLNRVLKAKRPGRTSTIRSK